MVEISRTTIKAEIEYNKTKAQAGAPSQRTECKSINNAPHKPKHRAQYKHQSSIQQNTTQKENRNKTQKG